MKSSSPANLIIMVFLGFVTIIAVLVFAGIVPWFGSDKAKFGGTVVLWGTTPADVLVESLASLNKENENNFKLSYVEKEKETFESELVEALASGVGPDMIILPQDLILKNKNKIFTIPFDSYPLRTFKDNFIEEGELYITNEGAVALPLYVDPIVMYWNRDLFSGAGVARPPLYWDELLLLATELSLSDQAGNIFQSTVSFGEFVNIDNAKDILSMLILQTGNKIVDTDEKGAIGSVFNQGDGAKSALRFYTQFSDPVKETYSWNRSLASSKDYFASGNLAIYFGFASEIDDIKLKNPHLNFDIAPVPQIRDGNTKATFGNMSGVAVLKASKNISTAFSVAFALSGSSFVDSASKSTKLAPALRSLLVEDTSDPYAPIFYREALISKGWLDPNSQETDRIFQTMVEGITSGRDNESAAVSRVNLELNRLLKK